MRPATLTQLRNLLSERFPSSRRTPGRLLATGVAPIDDHVGGLPLGAVSEIVCAAPSCGSHLLVGRVLETTRANRIRVALVDGDDSFDPGSFRPDLLAHLVWVRCAHTAAALQAADLLARDANLSLVVLDLRLAPENALRRIPATHWYRLQRAVEPADLALMILSPRACVPSAQLRFQLSTPHPPVALDRERSALAAELPASLQRQRLQSAAG